MSWYAAHLVMFVEFKEAVQDRYPVWENIVLLEAATEDEAFEKADCRGRGDEGDDDGSFRWGKKPARWVFAVVRKLTECPIVSGSPTDGTEISFTELELCSRDAVRKLAAGLPVEALYNDRFSPVAPRGTCTGDERKPRKKKHA
jgi:hypothetical protein